MKPTKATMGIRDTICVLWSSIQQRIHEFTNPGSLHKLQGNKRQKSAHHLEQSQVLNCMEMSRWYNRDLDHQLYHMMGWVARECPKRCVAIVVPSLLRLFTALLQHHHVGGGTKTLVGVKFRWFHSANQGRMTTMWQGAIHLLSFHILLESLWRWLIIFVWCHPCRTRNCERPSKPLGAVKCKTMVFALSKRRIDWIMAIAAQNVVNQ